MGTEHLGSVLGASRSVVAGDLLGGADFFLPWHDAHLIARCPEVEQLLQLPPGSRFLIAPRYQDVWHDPALLDVTE